MPFNNVRQWRDKLTDVSKSRQTAMRSSINAIALSTRDGIRNRIPPGATASAGMSNVFPGYAATGRLKSRFIAGPVRTTGGGRTFTARVGLSPSASRLDRIKAFVHENGATIHARNKPYLVFRVQGHWVRVKSVRIKPKRYFHSGWEEARLHFAETVGLYMRRLGR